MNTEINYKQQYEQLEKENEKLMDNEILLKMKIQDLTKLNRELNRTIDTSKDLVMRKTEYILELKSEKKALKEKIENFKKQSDDLNLENAMYKTYADNFEKDCKNYEQIINGFKIKTDDTMSKDEIRIE